jgi:hypothetical protein
MSRHKQWSDFVSQSLDCRLFFGFPACFAVFCSTVIPRSISTNPTSHGFSKTCSTGTLPWCQSHVGQGTFTKATHLLTPLTCTHRSPASVRFNRPDSLRNSFRRRNFRSYDCTLGTQSHANPIGLPGASRGDHFLPQNRLAFAFHVRMDGEWKPD